MNTYKFRFLVATDSWEKVKKLFKDDLGITKEKKDDTVIAIRDHYIVEVELQESDLVDEFYEKVEHSKYITILNDRYSAEHANAVLSAVTPVETRLRELAVYAYDLAATYKKIMKLKHEDVKQLVAKNQMVGENLIDPLLSFFDFGELIIFLGKTGNNVDDSNIADDTARLIESSSSFEEFRSKFTKRFKKLSVWEIISEAILAKSLAWPDLQRDLTILKNTRNTALHHRVLSPKKVSEARKISARLIKQFKAKIPQNQDIKKMDAAFDSWNTALLDHDSYQRALDRTASIDTSALQRVLETQSNAQSAAQRALESISNNLPDAKLSALSSLSRSIDAINRLGLSSWIPDTRYENTASDEMEDGTKTGGDSKNNEAGNSTVDSGEFTDDKDGKDGSEKESK